MPTLGLQYHQVKWDFLDVLHHKTFSSGKSQLHFNAIFNLSNEVYIGFPATFGCPENLQRQVSRITLIRHMNHLTWLYLRWRSNVSAPNSSAICGGLSTQKWCRKRLPVTWSNVMWNNSLQCEVSPFLCLYVKAEETRFVCLCLSLHSFWLLLTARDCERGAALQRCYSNPPEKLLPLLCL